MAIAPPTRPNGPPQPDPDLQTGLQHLRAGWYDRAEPLFQSARVRYGDRPDILHYLAVCLSQRGAVKEAEGLWRKAVARDPNEPMLLYNLGLAARRLGNLDEAARRFRDTIRQAPHPRRGAPGAGLGPHGHRALRCRRARIVGVRGQRRSCDPRTWHGYTETPAGARPQHAGLCALPAGPVFRRHRGVRHGAGRRRRQRRAPRPDPGRPLAFPGGPRPLRRSHCRGRPGPSNWRRPARR